MMETKKPKWIARADKRCYFNPPLNILMTADKTEQQVGMTDLSRTGLGFESKTQHAKGDRLKFYLRIEQGERLLYYDLTDKTHEKPLLRYAKERLSDTVEAKVIAVSGPDKNGVYKYGVKFYTLTYWYIKNYVHTFIYKSFRR